MLDDTTPRLAAIRAVIDAVAAFPDIPADTLTPHLDALPDQNRGKAVALHRTVLQRWLTLTALLNHGSKSPVEKFEAPVQAVLLVGAAELLFFDSPGYAVIDESVEASRSLNRLKALGLINALLRRVDELVESRSDRPWQPEPHQIPDGGGAVELCEPVLPPTTNLMRHLAVATSHPRPLVRQWIAGHGPDAATQICLAGIATPGTHAVDEHGNSQRWQESNAALRDWLARHPLRRVQDPASTQAITSAKEQNLSPATILDLCAGRGTKTKQLSGEFSEARVVAWDPDDARRSDLLQLQNQMDDRLAVREPKAGEAFDLVLLDVPCSNTGVLARRPEARYRWNADRLASLLELQREILQRGWQHTADGGYLLYSTCSVNSAENADQARWLLDAASVQGGPPTALVYEQQWLPRPGFLGTNDASEAGSPAGGGHDGSYHALIRRGG